MDAINFDNSFDAGILDAEYMEFIINNADPEVLPIYNGDCLTEAFEKGYLFEEFRNSKINEL